VEGRHPNVWLPAATLPELAGQFAAAPPPVDVRDETDNLLARRLQQ